MDGGMGAAYFHGLNRGVYFKKKFTKYNHYWKKLQ